MLTAMKMMTFTNFITSPRIGGLSKLRICSETMHALTHTLRLLTRIERTQYPFRTVSDGGRMTRADNNKACPWKGLYFLRACNRKCVIWRWLIAVSLLALL